MYVIKTDCVQSMFFFYVTQVSQVVECYSLIWYMDLLIVQDFQSAMFLIRVWNTEAMIDHWLH